MKKLTKYCSYIAGVSRALSGKQRAGMTGKRRDDFRVRPGIMFSLASLLLLSLLPGRTFAGVNCTANFTGRTTYVDYNVPIITEGIQISVLKNKPIGDVVWQQTILNPDKSPIGFSQCASSEDNTQRILHTYVIDIEGAMPAIVGQWKGLNVYDTGVPGIGLVIRGGRYGDLKYPYISQGYDGSSGPPPQGTTNTSVAFTVGNESLNMEILLVKTGDVPSGVWNLPIRLPAFTLHVDFMEDESGPEKSRDYSSRLMIDGSINIVAGTCQTHDVNVSMGRYSVSADMENTPWVDFTIELNNCPPMSGFYSRSQIGSNSSSPNRWEGPGNFTVTDKTPNTIDVLFIPVYGFNEMPNGEWCGNIAPTADAASGVCLEIQDKLNVGVLEKGSYNLPVDSGLNLLNSVANYSIPLKARYVRTADSATMTAGRADSAVEFTINYY
ncbi:TPA: type 1 fimbrial protein [Klebsiella oxytoca]|nr:type 1 fimbrial protein [Klebsiella oxytoca]HBM3050982.1 type 1 fimbrial protein [Klebsiella oxytoca]